MYLYHSTSLKNAINILKDGYIKSAHILLKEGRKNVVQLGDGAYYDSYKPNKYVYFQCNNELHSKKPSSSINLYFSSDLLYNRVFYASMYWTSTPEKTMKFNKYYDKYNDVLIKLLNRKTETLDQIAIKNKVNLKKLCGVEIFDIRDCDKKLLTTLNKYYPNVTIMLNKSVWKKYGGSDLTDEDKEILKRFPNIIVV
jgi:hypothetical protein